MSYSTEFALQDEVIYLNHAAVSPWPQRTVNAVSAFAAENGNQGSLSYPQWMQTEQALRDQLRDLINAPSSNDIALVKNTSEALSFVAAGIDWHAGDNLVSSNQEFPSNRIVWESLSPLGVELRQADLDSADTPEDALFNLVDEKTRMIAISSVQYATGTKMDLERIGRFCEEKGLLFCIDAIQSIGAVPLDVQACKAHFVAADGHKWMTGPEGLGVFYCNASMRDKLRLTQFGWHMVEAVGDFDRKEWQPAASARRFECGSPNMLAIHALHASLSLLLETGMELVSDHILANSRFLFDGLMAMGYSIVTPTTTGRYAGIVSFYHSNIASDKIHAKLDENGVFCALRGGNIRFSPHFYTPRAHLEHVLELLKPETFQ
jgi:selenocysteine lyase/cysteine desulfurase